MLVKKFEAKTMKEALEMVKIHLGPEAIIINAKDNAKTYGIAGQGSVEITAAISDEVLHKKKMAESKMNESTKEQFISSSAKNQKRFINKVIQNYHEEQTTKKTITKTPYIDILDLNSNSNPNLNFESNSNSNSGIELVTSNKSLSIPSDKNMKSHQIQTVSHNEMESLRRELESLKSIVSQFKEIPQNFIQNQFPGSDYGLPFDMSYVFDKMTSSGIQSEIAAEILLLAKDEITPIKYKNKALLEGWVAKYLLKSFSISSELPSSRFVLFVGPPGQGKTSSLVKFASHLSLSRKKKIALLTTDSIKIGAVEQMRIFAQILNVPFAIVRNHFDWSYINEKIQDIDYFLCDFPGLSLKNIEEINFLKSHYPPIAYKPHIFLVLNATRKDFEINEVGKRYQNSHFKDVIFSGLDETQQIGTIYNFIKNFSVSLHSCGVGPKIPEDFELGNREKLIDTILKLSNFSKAEGQ